MALGTVAEAAHDAVGQRAVVYTDADCRIVLAAYVEKRREFFSEFLNLFGIFFVGKLHLAERAARVVEIAGVDAHFLYMLCGLYSHCRHEVYVGHQGHVAAVGYEPGLDVGKVGCMGDRLCRESHQLCPGFGEGLDLGHGCLGVEGGSGGHGLGHYVDIRPYDDIADMHRRGVSAVWCV